MTENTEGNPAESATKAQKPKHTVVEVVANSVEEGVEAGALAMGVDTSLVKPEIIEEKSGFMGLGKRKIRLRVRYQPPKTEELAVPEEEEEEEPNVDGRFLIGFKDGAFQLLVTAPQGEGTLVAESDVHAALEGLPIPEGAEDFWVQEVESPSGIPIALSGLDEADLEENGEESEAAGPADAEALLATLPDAESDDDDENTSDGAPAGEDDGDGDDETSVGSAAIALSTDRMRAWIGSSTLSFTEALAAEDAAKALQESGITHGANDALIARVVGRTLLRPVQIAQGVEPVLSIDGGPSISRWTFPRRHWRRSSRIPRKRGHPKIPRRKMAKARQARTTRPPSQSTGSSSSHCKPLSRAKCWPWKSRP